MNAESKRKALMPNILQNNPLRIIFMYAAKNTSAIYILSDFYMPVNLAELRTSVEGLYDQIMREARRSRRGAAIEAFDVQLYQELCSCSEEQVRQIVKRGLDALPIDLHDDVLSLSFLRQTLSNLPLYVQRGTTMNEMRESYRATEDEEGKRLKALHYFISPRAATRKISVR